MANEANNPQPAPEEPGTPGPRAHASSEEQPDIVLEQATSLAGALGEEVGAPDTAPPTRNVEVPVTETEELAREVDRQLEEIDDLMRTTASQVGTAAGASDTIEPAPPSDLPTAAGGVAGNDASTRTEPEATPLDGSDVQGAEERQEASAPAPARPDPPPTIRPEDLGYGMDDLVAPPAGTAAAHQAGTDAADGVHSTHARPTWAGAGSGAAQRGATQETSKDVSGPGAPEAGQACSGTEPPGTAALETQTAPPGQVETGAPGAGPERSAPLGARTAEDFDRALRSLTDPGGVAAGESEGAALDESGYRRLSPRIERALVGICDTVVRGVELADRPFRGIGPAARAVVGFVAIGTLATALLTLLISAL
jgi:hypothetical protein